MSSNKIDKATNTITSSNKFLHELKRIIINIITYLVLVFIAYENRALLIEQATKTVIHTEVVNEFDHLPHLDVEQWEKEKGYIISRLDKHYKLIKNKERNVSVIVKKVNKDSLEIKEIYRRLDILLEKINKL